MRHRKQRRAMRAILKFGHGARPTHKLRSGRTGSANSKRLQSLRDGAKRSPK